MVHRWKWCCLVRWRHESPRSMSCQHLWVHSPAPCRAPCPALPHRLRRSVPRHSVGAGCGVAGSLLAGGRVVVDGALHKRVRFGGRDWWPRSWSSCWPSSLLMAWASLVFEVVGVPAGRGLGGHVSCPRPLPGVTRPASPECPSPLYWGWLLGGWCVACVWSWLLLMSWVIRVFEVVGVVAGRGVGCPGGRGRCWWCGLRWCSTLWAWLLAEDWVVVRVVAGRCRCRWG